MLIQKKTLLTRHDVQKSNGHVYFEYDAFEGSEAKPHEYLVGYYMPMADWLCMGSPTDITVTVEPGNAGMSVGMKDEGVWGDEDTDLNDLHDIDNNISMDASVRHTVQDEIANA